MLVESLSSHTLLRVISLESRVISVVPGGGSSGNIYCPRLRTLQVIVVESCKVDGRGILSVSIALTLYDR
jgi:hypothetical protein